MRNKSELNKDWDKSIKESIRKETDCVEMCAHDMNHLKTNFVEVPAVHTVSGKGVRFNFKNIVRNGTPEELNGLAGHEEVDDYEYIGME